MADDWPRAIEIEPEIGRYADVANAIDQGEPAMAHALLRARLASGSPAEEKRVIRRLLDHPVLFAIPITSGPGLGRLNGIGTGLYGHQDVPSAEGAYVATRCFSFAWIPLVPIDRYVVRDAEGGGWYFLAKLPLRSWQRAVRTTALAVFILGLAALAAAIWNASTTDEVHVVNGLDETVWVAVGDATLEVPPGGRAKTTLPDGSHFLRCTTTGERVIDEQTVYVDGGHDLVVYNPLGAAPLYTTSVIYSSNETSSEQPKARPLAGRAWTSIDSVDHVFEDPPDSVSTKSDRDVVRVIAQVAEGGWRTSVNWLIDRGQGSVAQHVAQQVAAAFPDDPEPYAWAVMTAADHGRAKDLAGLAHVGYARLSDDVDAHRQLQSQFKLIGKADVLLPHYEARSIEDTENNDNRYLFAELLPRHQAIPIYEEVLRRDPAHHWSQRGLAWAYYHSERFEDALPYYEALLPTDPNASVQPVEFHVRCLTALDRIPEALAVARSAAVQVTPETPQALALMRLYARVCALVEGGSPALLPGALIQQRLGENIAPRDVIWVLAQAASSEELPSWLERVEDPMWREWAEIMRMSRTVPEQVPALAGQASQDAVRQLTAPVLVGLVCELCRTQEYEAAQLLYLGVPRHVRNTLSFEVLRDLTEVSALDATVDLEIRAVLWDAKARRTEDEEQKAVMRKRAQLLDTLRCTVPR